MITRHLKLTEIAGMKVLKLSGVASPYAGDGNPTNYLFAM